MKTKQKLLIQRLQELIAEINEEAISDDKFYDWLNKNYFFNEELEEILVKIKNAQESFK